LSLHVEDERTPCEAIGFQIPVEHNGVDRGHDFCTNDGELFLAIRDDLDNGPLYLVVNEFDRLQIFFLRKRQQLFQRFQLGFLDQRIQ